MIDFSKWGILHRMIDNKPSVFCFNRGTTTANVAVFKPKERIKYNKIT